MAASEGITEHEVNPPYELLLQHNASIFGRHAAGKTILVLREVPACSSQALSGVVPQVDEQTQRLLRDLALATQKLTRGHVVEYVAAATDVMDASMLSNPVRNTSLNRCGHLFMPRRIKKSIWRARTMN